MVLILLTISDVEHIFMCLLASLFSSFARFLIGLFVYLVFSYMSSLYILEINYLSVVLFATVFSHSEGCLFTLLIVSFVVQKLLSLIRSHSGRWVIEGPAVIYVGECFAYVLL